MKNWNCWGHIWFMFFSPSRMESTQGLSDGMILCGSVCIPALHCQTSLYVLSSAFIKHLAINQGWHLELKICWSNNTSVMRGIKSIYWQSGKAHACTAFIAVLRCTESNTDECDETLIPAYVHFSQFRQTSFVVLPKTWVFGFSFSGYFSKEFGIFYENLEFFCSNSSEFSNSTIILTSRILC